MKQSHKTLLLWVLLILMFVAIWQFLQPPDRRPNVAFSDFLNEVHAGNVEQITIKDKKFVFRVKASETTKAWVEKETKGPAVDGKLLESFRPTAPDKADKVPRIIFEEEEANPLWSGTLITLLPMVFIIVMFFLFMRQLQAGGGKAMSFGKAKAKMLSDSQNKITFADVAGVDEAKDEVEEIIAFLKDPKKFQRLGGRIPKGVLMIGPPGTGKTLLARAIAGEAGVPFFSISGSDFVEMFVGVGASRVRDLFEQGKKHAPCIIFIDEIDAVGRHRGAGLGGGHDEREQTLNQLLVEMDGFESNEGVIIIAATNRPDVLDPAILRPGRFDRRITVSRPDVRGREAILRVHTKKTPLSPDVDLEIIARGTPGFAGADLENLVNEAALLAARQDKDAIGMADFELAKDKVLMGSERRSMVMTEDEKWNTAVHEAGHSVVMLTNPQHDPIHKVTIIPRGRALGVTMPLPKGDILGRTKDQFEAQIQAALGGRIAEEIFFGKMTTGAANDIRVVTDIARAMVCEYGMSEKLGTLAYGHEEGSLFLGRDFAQRQTDYSEQTAREIDQEVRRIVQEQYDQVRQVLQDKRDTVEAIAKALMDRETLDFEELMALLEHRELPKRDRVVVPTYADKEKKEKDKRKVASIFGATPSQTRDGLTPAWVFTGLGAARRNGRAAPIVVLLVRGVIVTPGAWVACLVVMLVVMGCGYRELAPPAAPASAVPTIDEPPTAAPAEGSSRITFEVEGERASVYRQVEMAQPAERQVTRSRNAPAAYDRYELLCVTPCVADVRQGAHVVRFESLTDAERTSEAMVLAHKQPTIVRHALGRKESVSTGYIAFTFLTASGIILGTFSGVSGLASLAGDRWRTEDGKRYDAHAEAHSALIFAGVSGAVSLVGALGMILTRPDWQNGASIQFQQP